MDCETFSKPCRMLDVFIIYNSINVMVRVAELDVISTPLCTSTSNLETDTGYAVSSILSSAQKASLRFLMPLLVTRRLNPRHWALSAVSVPWTERITRWLARLLLLNLFKIKALSKLNGSRTHIFNHFSVTMIFATAQTFNRLLTHSKGHKQSIKNYGGKNTCIDLNVHFGSFKGS